MEGFVFVLVLYLLCREMALVMAPVQDWSEAKVDAIRVLELAPAYTNASELIPCVAHTTVKYYGYVDRETRAFYSLRWWLRNTLYITPLASPSSPILIERCVVRDWGESTDINAFLRQIYFYYDWEEHMPPQVWREREPQEASTTAKTIREPSSLLRGRDT